MPSSSSSTRDTLRVFWQHGRRYRFVMSVIFFGTIINVLVSKIVVQWYLKKFFDIISEAAPHIQGTETLQASATHALLVVFAFWLCSNILYRGIGFCTTYFQTHVMTDLQQSSFAYLLEHSYQFFSNAFSGGLVRKVSRLARSFEDVADQIQFSLLPLVIEIMGIIYVLSLRSSMIALIMAGWLLIFMGFNYWFARWKLPIDIQKAEKDSETTAVLADAVSNSITIQLFSGHAHERGLFQRVTEEFRRLQMRSWNLNEANFAIQGLLIVCIQFAVFMYALQLWKQGKVTVGDFVLFEGYLTVLTSSLWDFHRVIRRLHEAFADAKEMVDILHTPHEVKDKRGAKELQVSRGKIEFKDVVFNYHKTRKVLDSLNLSIRAKEKVALVGSSGAGKSTVIKVLFRFYDIDRGKILIDGQSIKDVTQDSLREAIALVPQEPILFHRTLMENIRYGRREATDQEVIIAAMRAHCHEFIESLPQKYETLVGERGIKLSGGERQRVAIARAILKNAPILVLDEATSSLDSESEALIQDALHTLMQDKTVIVIAHRLSTIMQMDRIIVMEHGKVVDSGTHEELVNQTGIYQKLWKIQAGGFLK